MNGICLAALNQPRECVFPDCLQHRVALTITDDETAIHERLERVEVCVADRLRPREREPSGEHGEPREQTLLRLAQEVVAPADGRVERVLAPRSVTWAPGQQWKALIEAQQDLSRRQGLGPGRREFDRQRQVVNSLADPSREIRVHAHAWRNGPHTLAEQLDRVGALQDRDVVLALAGEAQRLTARHQQREGGAVRQQPCNQRGPLDQLLKVV